MNRRAPANERGFTLLEVMLAFVLLAMLMGLAISAMSNGLRQVRRAQDQTRATLYAQSLLDGLGVLAPMAPGQRDGTFEAGRYRYRLDIRPTRDPAPIIAVPTAVTSATPTTVLYRVALQVEWGDAAAGQRLNFTSLRARVAPVAGVAP
jgi:general secretion pathway protein I